MFTQIFSCRRDSDSKSLWDEAEINSSLRSFALSDVVVPCAASPEDIFAAVDDDDADRVAVIVRGVAVSKLNKLILYAVWKGAAGTVKMLLDRNASPNAADAAGRTCLHLAAIHGKMEVLHELSNKCRANHLPILI